MNINDKWLSFLGLRTRLLILNGVVVAALVFLGLLAWRASASQDEAQAVQVKWSEALRLSITSDMHHDATRGYTLAVLLRGQLGEPLAESQGAVNEASAAMVASLRKLSSMGLPGPVAGAVDQQVAQADIYADLAQTVATLAGQRDVLRSAPFREFERLHTELVRSLASIGNDVSAALESSRRDAAQQAERGRWALLGVCALTIALTSLVVFVITQSIRFRLRSMAAVAATIAGGDLASRIQARGSDELAGVGQAIDRMADGLSHMIDAMRTDTDRALFGKQLSEALDMADSEGQVAETSARAMAEISPQHRMELLLSDSSKAQLERAAQHPDTGAAGCGVTSPYDCVAVRRGSSVGFENSEALNACTHLRGRSCGSVSAVCVPVTFMGRAIGVLHAAGPVAEPLLPHQAQQLATLGGQIGMRIGTVRAFEKTQLQAATDSLTGLPNRRTLEERLRNLVTAGQPYALVMADLDRFKMLNDTHGHAAGDLALRLFSDVLRSCLRGDDVAGRWGGEEFAFVLAGADAQAAKAMADRLRKRLASSLATGRGPAFTCSFGVSDSSMAARAEDLIQLADVALYQAKASGRDRACVADPAAQHEEPVVRESDLSGRGINTEATASAMD
jgi:diguanylate cyclase (GGDEF)-like protein